jgi:membrane protein
MMSLDAFLRFVHDVLAGWNQHKVPRLAAALSYYTIFSLAPLLVIIIAVIGLVYGRQAAQSQIVAQVGAWVGEESARTIQDMIKNASDFGSSVFATMLGSLLLLFGAAGLFGQLQDALNTIWEAQPKLGRGIRGLVRNRVLSFIFVLAMGPILLLSLLLSTLAAFARQYFIAFLPLPANTLGTIDLLLSLITMTVLFAIVFKVLPDVPIAWRDVWLGALLTALLFIAGKFLIAWYLANSRVDTIYGAASSLVVTLIWVYYSAQILLLGAEVTQVYARNFGSLVVTQASKVAGVALPDKSI